MIHMSEETEVSDVRRIALKAHELLRSNKWHVILGDTSINYVHVTDVTVPREKWKVKVEQRRDRQARMEVLHQSHPVAIEQGSICHPTLSSTTNPRPYLQKSPSQAIVQEAIIGEQVLKTGWLYQRGFKTKQWKRRWCVLRKDRFAYYKNEKEYETKRIVPAADISAVTHKKSERKFVFLIYIKKKEYYFQANSEQEVEDWIKAIRKVAISKQENEASGSLYSGASPLAVSSNSRTHPGNQISSGFPALSDISPPLVSSFQQSTLQRTSSSDEEYHTGPEFSSDGDGDKYTLPSIVNNQVTRSAEFNRQQIEQSQVRAIRDEGEDRVIMHGYLYRQHHMAYKRWVRRWVVLRSYGLFIYRDREEYKPIKVCPFSTIVSAVELDPLGKDKTHCFQVITDEKALRFCAETEDLADKWLGAILSRLEKTSKTNEPQT